jgi:glycine/D-amino acid oxidase-like deaminating enzyme
MALSERGLRVVVVEMGTPASGPTGRSSAVLRGYYVNEFLAQATRESVGLFKNFSEWTHGGEARHVVCGGLYLHAEPDGPKLMKAAVYLNEIGTRTDVLDRARLASEFPMFDLEGIAWGAWEDEAGHADPAGTTNGMINRAVQLGAELRRHARVTSIRHMRSGVRLTTADGGAVEAGTLLLAAGPWSSQLLGMIGVELPLWAERHIIATYGWGGTQQVPFVWASVPDGIYFKPELHAQYLVGTLWSEDHADPDDFDHELSPQEQLRITMATVGRLPSLEESEAFSGYSALYDVAPDWQPVIGNVDDSIFIVAGTAGHGFKWAPALGRHVADLLTGAEADPGLAQFHPSRFARGALVDAGYGEAKILG